MHQSIRAIIALIGINFKPAFTSCKTENVSGAKIHEALVIINIIIVTIITIVISIISIIGVCRTVEAP